LTTQTANLSRARRSSVWRTRRVTAAIFMNKLQRSIAFQVGLQNILKGVHELCNNSFLLLLEDRLPLKAYHLKKGLCNSFLREALKCHNKLHNKLLNKRSLNYRGLHLHKIYRHDKHLPRKHFHNRLRYRELLLVKLPRSDQLHKTPLHDSLPRSQPSEIASYARE
jgi:hypothetical protein